ncbi:hypothetical protein M408DRAFT_61227 [Serendipita vermifera MAFF 305830]|uniref:MOSC domain-containing protein n=1 Tax=Serendipita vermifera MAFF 305830 TaxID=933852 RepID=A0A0C2X6B9_SERVB|nr:hypothetical protein M408DRAFT_61227 [Serendipita vermifera MAFF 305830]
MKVTRIFVHPIKSCKGTSVQSSEYTPQGLKYDRMFVIVDKETHNMYTARDVPKMVLIHPQVHPDTDAATGGALEIRFPEDSGIDTIQVALQPNDKLLDTWPRLEDVQIWSSTTDAHVAPALEGSSSEDPSLALSRYLDRDVLLVYKGRTTRYFTNDKMNLKGPTAFQDGYPILIATEESLRDVETKVDLSASGAEGWAIPGVVNGGWNGDIAMERFRPNIVLEGSGTPYAEEEWEEIGFHRAPDAENEQGEGGASSPYGRLVCISKCTRCRLPNIDPENGVQHAHVPYKVLAKYRRVDTVKKALPCFGINSVACESGVYKVGDVVRVRKMMNVTS